LFGGKYPKLSPAPIYLLFSEVVSRGARLKEGKAIKIKIKAGVIVQINSIVVPWFKYLCDIGDLLLL
jgi:hypothetical protein